MHVRSVELVEYVSGMTCVLHLPNREAVFVAPGFGTRGILVHWSAHHGFCDGKRIRLFAVDNVHWPIAPALIYPMWYNFRCAWPYVWRHRRVEASASLIRLWLRFGELMHQYDGQRLATLIVVPNLLFVYATTLEGFCIMTESLYYDR